MRRTRKELKCRHRSLQAAFASRGQGAPRGAICEKWQPLRDDSGELNRKNSKKKKRGAPFDNKNRLVHGWFSREAEALKVEIRRHVAEAKQLAPTSHDR